MLKGGNCSHRLNSQSFLLGKSSAWGNHYETPLLENSKVDVAASAFAIKLLGYFLNTHTQIILIQLFFFCQSLCFSISRKMVLEKGLKCLLPLWLFLYPFGLMQFHPTAGVNPVELFPSMTPWSEGSRIQSLLVSPWGNGQKGVVFSILETALCCHEAERGGCICFPSLSCLRN